LIFSIFWWGKIKTWCFGNLFLEEKRRQKRQKKARIFPHPKQVAEDEERFFFVGV